MLMSIRLMVLWLGALAGTPYMHGASVPTAARTGAPTENAIGAPDGDKKPGAPPPGDKAPAPPPPAPPPPAPPPSPLPPAPSPPKPPRSPTELSCTLVTQEAPRGGRLEVEGANFGQTPVVRIADKVTRILSRTATTIAVQIARDSDGGPVTVQSGSAKAICGWLTIIGKDR